MYTHDWYENGACEKLILLAELVKNQKGHYVEIGPWEGRTTIEICKAIEPQVLMCVDRWKGFIHESEACGYEHKTVTTAKSQNVKNVFISNMKKNVCENYRVLEYDPIELGVFFKSPLKFIHLNADNSYGFVKSVISMYLPNLLRGGVICGYHFKTAGTHRTDLGGGVEKAVNELIPDRMVYGDLWWWQKN